MSTTRAAWMLRFATSGFTERMALQWVRKYIQAFGGDPHKVTMYGNSHFNVEVAHFSQLWSKCGGNLGITSDVGIRWGHRRLVPRRIHDVRLSFTSR